MKSIDGMCVECGKVLGEHLPPRGVRWWLRECTYCRCFVPITFTFHYGSTKRINRYFRESGFIYNMMASGWNPQIVRQYMKKHKELKDGNMREFFGCKCGDIVSECHVCKLDRLTKKYNHQKYKRVKET